MDRTNQYKQRHVPFGSVGARLARARKIEDWRKERRAEHLARFRTDSIVQNDNNKVEIKEETRQDRMTRLEKWRAERKLKKELEAKNKQPIFKVGVPHGNIFSSRPVDSQVAHCHRRKGNECKRSQPTPPKRITRATQKRLTAKQAGLLKSADIHKSNIEEKLKKIPNKEKKKENFSVKLQNENIKSIAPNDYVFKGPSGINPLPMFGRIWIPLSKELTDQNVESLEEVDETSTQHESESSNNHHSGESNILSTASIQKIHTEQKNDINEAKYSVMEVDEKNEIPVIQATEELNETSRTCSPVPAEFSPYIITSRGKSSARKEQRKRLGMNDSLVDIIPTKETVMQSLNISIEEEEKTAQYYKILLKQQIKRLTSLCTKWEEIQTEFETTEDGKYMINQAIGQANLLMQKKFERFRNLVLDCETGKGEMLVRCRDLQAFWDIILMQIKDCDMRFDKLLELKEKNWIEEDVAEVVQIKKKTTLNKRKKIVAKSSARAFIEAARKKKLESTYNTSMKLDKNEMESECVTPEAKSSVTSSAKRQSTKKVQKLLDTSFTVMRVSLMGKTPEVKLDSTISYVNSNQTPGRGILKRSEDAEKEGILQKSIYKVNFNEKISTNEDSPMNVKIASSVNNKKQFDFLSDSYNKDIQKDVVIENKYINSLIPTAREIPTTSNNEYQGEQLDCDLLQSIPSTEIDLTVNANKTPKKMKIRSSDSSINDSPTLNTRVLRNRTIVTDNTPAKTRSSSERNDSLILKSNENLYDDTAKENVHQIFNHRRSTRKSVKFDSEDCTACAMTKPTLPMTPRRNKKLSLLGEIDCRESINILPNGDLISFNSPVTPRRKSRRINKQ